MTFPHTATIQVLQSDINMGKPCDSRRCPTAIAATRHFDIYTRVWRETLWIGWTGHFAEYRLDEVGERFVEEFDAGLPVSPCTITLERIPLSKAF
jgi:hypothetical protein